ncbi:MAG TPA: apolipoprotein N-acyltransferase [Egibacteraceae bacterium]|nr:apolipoprotein N-acyltransferase [Egibacteraceae bacterium]
MSRRPRRALLALAGGALLFAGHPPLGWGAVGLLALVPLLALARDVAEDDRPVRAGLGWGLLAGAAFFTPLLYWIAIVEPIALPLLVLVQATSVAAFVAGLAAWGSWPLRPAVAVVWWVGLEAARSAAPWGGFPWGVLGYTQHDVGVLLPVARTLGVLGVSAACATVAVCVEEALHRLRRLAGSPPSSSGIAEAAFAAVRAPLIGVLAVFAVAVVLGADPPATTGRTVDLAAVQGNDIADTRSLTRSRILEVGTRMADLTEGLAASPDGLPDVVVWPENALDADVTTGDNPELARLVDRALDALDGTPLIAGMLRTEDGRDYNTQAHLGPDGSVLDVYAKRSLVPFGEFVPLREYLGWVPPLERASNLSAGQEPGVFDVAGIRLGTVICFENNFPELTRSEVREGAEVLVVSTNNASFGFSPASSQHIAFSQVRAVESGRWVVHAGLNGISAVIGPDGRITQRTGLFEQAVLRADVPLVTDDTAFTRLGDLVGPAAMLLGAFGALWVGLSGRVRRPARSR